VEPTAPSTGEARQVVHPVSLIAGLLAMLLALGLIILAAQPPAPQAESASPNRFAAGRAMAILNRLLGDGTRHPIGSDANAQVGDRIASELTALGYPVEFQTSFACRLEWAICGQVTNIMTRLPGAAVGPAVLLTAHYDSVAAGPGAADDMAGVAAILEIARTLQVKDEPPLSSRPCHPHHDEGHVGRPARRRSRRRRGGAPASVAVAARRTPGITLCPAGCGPHPHRHYRDTVYLR
jgi:hypothetical protein